LSVLGWLGYISEVESYSRVKALVIQTQGFTPLVRYGALVEVEDAESSDLRYLAVVEDVGEKGVLPQVDARFGVRQVDHEGH